MRFYSFFHYISFLFGHNSVLLFKSWIKYRKILIKSRLKTEFLRKCIRLGIVPSHLATFLSNFDTNLSCRRSINSFKHCKRRFIKKLLQIELSDTYSCIRAAHIHIYKLSHSLYRYIPMSVCNSFFIRQQGPLYSFFIKQHNILNKKFSRLVHEQQKNEYIDIKPVQYFYRSHSHPQSTHGEFRFSFKPFDKSTNIHHRDSEIIIDPHTFKEKTQQSLNINDKWFVNLSSTTVPNEVQILLQLGV